MHNNECAAVCFKFPSMASTGLVCASQGGLPREPSTSSQRMHRRRILRAEHRRTYIYDHSYGDASLLDLIPLDRDTWRSTGNGSASTRAAPLCSATTRPPQRRKKHSFRQAQMLAWHCIVFHDSAKNNRLSGRSEPCMGVRSSMQTK
jgi:hypothetical protein